MKNILKHLKYQNLGILGGSPVARQITSVVLSSLSEKVLEKRVKVPSSKAKAGGRPEEWEDWDSALLNDSKAVAPPWENIEPEAWLRKGGQEEETMNLPAKEWEEELAVSWDRIRRKKGVGGADGETCASFGEHAEQHLARLGEQLRERSWVSHPPVEVQLPKGEGSYRPMALFSVRDRVVHGAMAQRLQAVGERRFSEQSWAYRPGRGVDGAIHSVLQEMNRGRRWVARVDIRNFFEEIPHQAVYREMKRLRVGDEEAFWVRRVLETARWHRGQLGYRSTGLCQGSPLSPVLSNIYLDHLDRRLEQVPFAKAFRYADDFLLVGRQRHSVVAMMKILNGFLKRDGLSLSRAEGPAHLAGWKGPLIFLGHEFHGKKTIQAKKFVTS